MFSSSLNIARRTVCCLLAGMAFVGVQAQRPSDYRQQAHDSLVSDHRIIYMGDGTTQPSAEESRKLIEQFYIDQFENTRQPSAPYFLFMSRDSNFAMGIGGDVRVRGYFDPGNSMPSSSFSPYDIPMERTELNRNHLGTSPSGTALYFRVIGRDKKMGNYSVYIKAKFNGGSGKDFKLNKAYATINDWTLGYATSTFSDGAAEPPTVDANGTTLGMDYTTLLVRYLHSFGKSGISIAGSVETPSLAFKPDVLADGTDAAVERSQSVPDLAAMVQYSWASGQHVRLSGIMRWLPYRNMVNSTNHTPIGFGLQLSAVASPIRELILYGTFNIGRSYTNNGGDFLLGKYDLVANPALEGGMKTIPAWSYVLGFSYYFSHKLFTTVSFGQARVTSSKLSDQYKYGLYGAVNLFYNLTPRIQFGGEFNFGKRMEFSGDHAYARRISAMAQFSF